MPNQHTRFQSPGESSKSKVRPNTDKNTGSKSIIISNKFDALVTEDTGTEIDTDVYKNSKDAGRHPQFEDNRRRGSPIVTSGHEQDAIEDAVYSLKRETEMPNSTSKSTAEISPAPETTGAEGPSSINLDQIDSLDEDSKRDPSYSEEHVQTSPSTGEPDQQAQPGIDFLQGEDCAENVK